MYLNRYNIKWLLIVGISFFVLYTSVNHLTAYLDSIKPVGHVVFAWEKYIPFIPVFIYPYMSIDLLYILAFFIIPKERYTNTIYRSTIKGLGLQLLVNQLFSLVSFLSFPLKFSFSKPPIPEEYSAIFNSLLSFDLPYNQAPSLHMSILVILIVFYNQHIGTKWIRVALNVWFFLIGLSVLFTYQHHFIDVVMGLFLGTAIVYAFNYSPNYLPSFHISERLRKGRAFLLYKTFVALFIIGLFILPILNHFYPIKPDWIDSQTGPIIYFLLWTTFVSFMMISKIMFYGNHINIRNDGHGFSKPYYFMGLSYFAVRKLCIYVANYYKGAVEVMPNLYIGNLLTARNFTLFNQSLKKHADNSKEASIVVFNLTWECDNKVLGTQSFPMVDLVIPSKKQVLDITAEIHKHMSSGNIVLVHCALGIFRTLFISGSYLVKYHNKTPEETLTYLLGLNLPPKVHNYLYQKRDMFTKLYTQIAVDT